MTNNLSLERGLYTPTLPQADNNIIDLNLIDDYIIIQITNYINIGNYDKIIVRFNSIESNPFIVYFINNPPQYTFVKFYKNTLASGTYTVNYSSQDIALNIAYSDSIVVKIINGLTYNLPAPSFPKAENMSVYYNTIVADKGLIIRARYSDMHLGDKIIFKWNGMDSDGYDIPESTIELDPIVVSNKDLENNFVDGLIPQRNIQILGINGSGYGMYSRTSSIDNKVKTDNSPKSHVYIVWENYNNLSMFISKKAAVRDSRYPYLLPSNKGAIFGQPGMMVDLFTDAHTNIVAVNSDDVVNSVVLNESGYATFQIYRNINVSGPGPVVVEASTKDTKVNSISSKSTFENYVNGKGGIYGYNYTDNIYADGNTPSSIYIYAVDNQQVIIAEVSENALINAWNNKIAIPVHMDKTATLSIITSTPGVYTVNLYTENNPQDIVTFYINFIV